MMGDGNLEKPHPEEGNNKGEEGLNNTDDLIQRRASLDSLDLTQSDGVANYLRPQRLSVSALDLPSWDDWQQDFDEDTRSVALQRAGEGRLTLAIAITAFVSAFGSSFPHGWNTGVLNAPSHLIKSFLNESYLARSGSEPLPAVLDILWALTVSIYLVGGCLGAFSAGWIADKYGRKKGLLICHVFGFVSAILFGFCQMALSLEMLIIARFIVGFGCGAGSGLVPMYLTEISPVNFRGAMGVLHQFALTCGILVSQIIGMRQLLGSENLWPVLLALTALPCAVGLAVLPFYPESPRYLYVNCGDVEAARSALQRFRGRDDVYLDLEEMRMEYEQQKSEPKWSFKKLLTTKSLRMPLAVVCALAMCQQLSGINVVFYYSTDVFLASGIPLNKTQYAVLGTGIINVLMTGISVPLMEKSGRRPLLMGGMLVMLLSAITITITLNLYETYSWMAYLSFVCVIGFVIGFAIGLGSIPQFIGAEIFKQGPRPPAMSISGFLNWLCNFLVGISYPSIESAIGAYSFVIFIGFLLSFGIFLFFKLPETKKKTYEEIAQMFNIHDESLTEVGPGRGGAEEQTLIEDRINHNGPTTSPSNLTETSFISREHSAPALSNNRI